VSEYPDFVPWCKASRIFTQSTRNEISEKDLHRLPHTMLAELTVNYRGFEEKYVSHIILEPYSKVKVIYI
jgi:ribosome-associated toxin RatA of RatAB toxin-antitoxin module